MIGLLLVATAAPAQMVGEYRVKALFIYNFAKFVEWPPGTFADPRDPFVMCLAGQDPFGQDFEAAVKGKTINSREIVIKRVAKVEEARACQVLFVALDKKRAKLLLSSLSANPVLSVGENEGFADGGGIICFAIEGNKVRFDINLEAAERAHLKISSKLLSLARSVKEPDKP
jgi:hypothetical protein